MGWILGRGLRVEVLTRSKTIDLNVIEILEVFLRTAVSVGAIIVFTRISGLRSFSKMSEYEFAVTVALGSVVAGMITATDKSLSIGMAALLGLFAIQAAIAHLRKRSGKMRALVDNKPLMLMHKDKLIEENLLRANIAEEDICGKLREANALQLDRVHAVILEATGDISVLHGEPDIAVDACILEGVQR